MQLTEENKATNYETCLHILTVQHNLNIMVKALLERGEKHDQSKLSPPEVNIFTEETKNLRINIWLSGIFPAIESDETGS